MKLILRCLRRFILIITVVFFLMVVSVYWNGRIKDFNAPSDAAIVLGAAVKGNEPSPVYRERINHGIDLFKRGIVQWLIFTGSKLDGAQYSDSEVAANYAIKNGVPKDRILIESRSFNTYQNLHYAKQVAKEKELRTFIIVSDPYHMRRAMTMAEQIGLNAQSSPTPTSRMNNIKFLVQEARRNFTYYYRLTTGGLPPQLSLDKNSKD